MAVTIFHIANILIGVVCVVMNLTNLYKLDPYRVVNDKKARYYKFYIWIGVINIALNSTDLF